RALGSGARREKLVFRFWKTDTHQAETSTSSQNSRPVIEEIVIKNDKEEHRNSFTLSTKETLKAAITHFGRKWYRENDKIHSNLCLTSISQVQDIVGLRLNLDIPKWMHILHLEKFNSNAVQWLTKASKSEHTYLYTMEKEFYNLSYAQEPPEGPVRFGANASSNGNGPSESADDDLPSVITCANYLKLPPYSTK
ncbi:hypothetical protein S83_063207, partial [Arachis hypogaea]